MVRAADTLSRRKNPGNDSAGVVGDDVTRIRYAGRDVQVCERHSRILGAGTRGDAGAGDKFNRPRSTA